MAVYYRAIWADSKDGLIDQACDRFCSWVRDKTDGELSAAGADERTDDGAFVFHLRDVMSENPGPVDRVVTGTFVENRSDGSRWTTTLRTWQGPAVREETGDAATWLWVDVDAVSHDSLDSVVSAAPRFVRSMITDGADANRRGVPVTESARTFNGGEGAEVLAALLTDIDRDIPIVVFSALPDRYTSRSLPPSQTVASAYEGAILRAARMTAGMAFVCDVDAAASAALDKAIGDSYSVRDGAFRVYLPGLDPALNEEWRHRYTLPSRYIGNPSTAGKLISRAISLKAGTRRAPDSFEAATRLLDAEATESSDLMALLEIADDENTQLNEQVAAMDQRYLALIDDQQAIEAENNNLRDQLQIARRKLALVESSLWESHADDMADIIDGPPADVVQPSEAAAMAKLHLHEHLSFPDEACADLQDIDSRFEARAWGSSSWRAFRALHAYAADLAKGEHGGDFWIWCQQSRHPLVWPATPKKLSMVESETVKRNDKLRAKRVFPVDRAVNASGKVFMEAHIKIAEGGSMLAPRIYFLASSVTKKVHIGYFGPHKHVPNTLS